MATTLLNAGVGGSKMFISNTPCFAPSVRPTLINKRSQLIVAMVSKSFCVIHCHCGKETTTRRDVDNNRGWEKNIRIFQCNHLVVDADMYTYSTYVPWGPSDEVRFRIQGKCFCNKNPCLTTSADSNRTSFSNGDDRGTLVCSHCGSRYDWVVSHRPHNLLEAVSFGALGYASGSRSGTIMPFVNAAKKTYAEQNIKFDQL